MKGVCSYLGFTRVKGSRSLTDSGPLFIFSGQKLFTHHRLVCLDRRKKDDPSTTILPCA